MRTGRSLTVRRSLLLGGGAWIWPPSISPLGVGLDLMPLNFPLGCGPGSDPPQFPPWEWAWIWSPSISPLGVGLDWIPLNFCLGCGPGRGGCLLLGGVSFLGGAAFWGVSLAGVFSFPGDASFWEVSFLGECLLLGGLLRGVPPSWGVPPSGGGCIPACTEADSPPPDRITDTSKNITLATTSLRPVKIMDIFCDSLGFIVVETPRESHARKDYTHRKAARKSLHLYNMQ